jgi:hypothetical protein
MPTKLLANLETDVPCTNSNVLGITDTKIDVADIRIARNQNAKMIGWNKIACWVPWNNSKKMQSHMTERESL